MYLNAFPVEMWFIFLNGTRRRRNKRYVIVRELVLFFNGNLYFYWKWYALSGFYLKIKQYWKLFFFLAVIIGVICTNVVMEKSYRGSSHICSFVGEDILHHSSKKGIKKIKSPEMEERRKCLYTTQTRTRKISDDLRNLCSTDKYLDTNFVNKTYLMKFRNGILTL